MNFFKKLPFESPLSKLKATVNSLLFSVVLPGRPAAGILSPGRRKQAHLFGNSVLIALFMFFLSVMPSAVSFHSVTGSESPGRIDLISVFLDFPYHTEYIRETITFVNYVRDRELADVHIMMSRHGSGSSGENFVISFIGKKRFEGMNNAITYWAAGTNTVDETRKGLVDIIRMGLVPYLAGTHMVNQVSVRINEDFSVERAGPDDDPWKNWVFEIYGGANFFKESKQSRFNSRWGFSINKNSDEWKIRFRPYFNLNERTFETDDGTIISRSHRHGFQGDLVRSIDQHWSAGLFIRMLSSTFHNMHFNIEASPGIEYSLFPYSEATRKSITFVYRLGVGHNNYLEETIFKKETETLANHAIDLTVRYQQPWGSFRAGITGSHYFHDFEANRAELFARLDLRILKGLSLNLSGNFDFINDLITLPAGDMTLEEILLQQRRQATNYQMSAAIGLAYSFGSQFTNVINTRF